MRRHRRYATASALSLVAGLLGSSLPCSAQPVEIRAGWAVPGQMVSVWNATPGVTKHQGKSYVLKDIYFRASSLMVTAMSSNELDLVLLPPATVNLAVTNAGVKDLRVIADESLDGFEDYFTTPFLVLKDSPIKSPADMKGKTFATLAVGSGVDLAGKYMMAQHGLVPQRDYNVVEVAPPNSKAFLLERKADLVFGLPPFVFDPEFQEKSRLLFTWRDSFGVPTATAYLAMKEEFIKKNRAAVVDFLEDYLRLARWHWDPANRKQVVTIMSNVTKVPPEVLDTYIVSKKDGYRPPDALPDLVANQRVIAAQKQIGFAKEEIKLVDHGELSMIKEAAQRLK